MYHSAVILNIMMSLIISRVCKQSEFTISIPCHHCLYRLCFLFNFHIYWPTIMKMYYRISSFSLRELRIWWGIGCDFTLPYGKLDLEFRKCCTCRPAEIGHSTLWVRSLSRKCWIGVTEAFCSRWGPTPVESKFGNQRIPLISCKQKLFFSLLCAPEN